MRLRALVGTSGSAHPAEIAVPLQGARFEAEVDVKAALRSGIDMRRAAIHAVFVPIAGQTGSTLFAIHLAVRNR